MQMKSSEMSFFDGNSTKSAVERRSIDSSGNWLISMATEQIVFVNDKLDYWSVDKLTRDTWRKKIEIIQCPGHRWCHLLSTLFKVQLWNSYFQIFKYFVEGNKNKRS